MANEAIHILKTQLKTMVNRRAQQLLKHEKVENGDQAIMVALEQVNEMSLIDFMEELLDYKDEQHG